jgi:hypothetical protein
MQGPEPVGKVVIWRINREKEHGQSACSMYSPVIDDVHANPVVTSVQHAEYILFKTGPWSPFPPCSDVTGHM